MAAAPGGGSNLHMGSAMPQRRQQPTYPYRRKQILSGQAVDVPYQFVDGNLAPRTLTSLRWRYDDLTHARTLQDWTEIPTPEYRGSITIPAEKNTLDRPVEERQLNQVIFEAVDDGGHVRRELAYVEVGAVFTGDR